MSPLLYFGFCDPATSAAPFQVRPGSFLSKLPFPHMPQKHLDIRLASCASLPVVVTRVRFEAKRDELESVAEAEGRAGSPLPAAAYIGVT